MLRPGSGFRGSHASFISAAQALVGPATSGPVRSKGTTGTRPSTVDEAPSLLRHRRGGAKHCEIRPTKASIGQELSLDEDSSQRTDALHCETASPQKSPHRAAIKSYMNCKYLKSLAPRVGFEPTTLRLTAECSTIELPRNNTSRAFSLQQRLRRDVNFSVAFRAAYFCAPYWIPS